MRRSLDIPDSEVRSREAERPSRRAEQVPHGSTIRNDDSSRGTETNLGKLGDPVGRPVCNKVPPAAPIVYFPGPGSGGLGDRRPSGTLEKCPGLRLFPSPSFGEGSKKGKGGKRLPHSSRPLLAGTTLVSRDHISVSSSFSSSKRVEKNADSTTVGLPPREPRLPKHTRLAFMRESLLSVGLDFQASSLVEDAHRSSMQGAYQSHWKAWLSWCELKGVSSYSPTSRELANYLASLSLDRGLSPSSNSVYRAAISTTIKQRGGPLFSEDPL